MCQYWAAWTATTQAHEQRSSHHTPHPAQPLAGRWCANSAGGGGGGDGDAGAGGGRGGGGATSLPSFAAFPHSGFDGGGGDDDRSEGNLAQTAHLQAAAYLTHGPVDRAQIAQYHAVLALGFRVQKGPRDLPFAAALNVAGASWAERDGGAEVVCGRVREAARA